MARVSIAAAVLALGAGCVAHPVGPARTFGKYEGKAVTTAEGALSAVESARLAARTAAEGGAFGPYTGTVISESEEGATSVQGTFDSIQPPGEQADELRSELDGLLSDAVSHLGDLRIAARRGGLGGLDDVARPLMADAEHLRSFIAARR